MRGVPKNFMCFYIKVKKFSFSSLLQAEARLAARRQARYEARNIRMRELEKKQKEEEDTNTNTSLGPATGQSGPHSLVQHTSSTNSNHNNIHSGHSGERRRYIHLHRHTVNCRVRSGEIKVDKYVAVGDKLFATSENICQ